MEYVGVAGIVIVFTLIGFVFSKKNLSTSDYLLILINLFLAGMLLLNMIAPGNFTRLTFVLHNVIPMLPFPTFCIYALKIIKSGDEINRKWLLVYLPSGVLMLFLIYDLYINKTYLLSDLETLYNDPPLVYHVFYKANQLMIIVILSWLIGRIKKFQQEIKSEFSYIEPIEGRWLYNCTWTFLLVTVSIIIIFLGENLKIIPIDVSGAFSILGIISVVAIFYMNIQGIQHYTVSQYYHSILTTQDKNNDGKTEVRRTTMSDASSEKILGEVREILQSDKMYLTPKLRLIEVANAIGESTHRVSEAINVSAEKSFHELVNEFRVNHLKQLLKDPKNKRMTILGLGLDSGFNSKASMNRIFKSQTGLTPLEFQKSIQS